MRPPVAVARGRPVYAHALYRSVGFVPSDGYPGREFEGADHDVSVFMRFDVA